MLNYAEILKLRSGPMYIYDLDGLEERAQFFKNLMPVNGAAHFAMKANNHPEVLKTLKAQGFGVDVVSLGELKLALELEFHPDQIVFSGVGKSVSEIQAAIEAGISQINVESLPELERIVQVAKKINKKARVAFRMNPDVDVSTHPYIRTGFRDNKFGIDFSDIDKLLEIVKNNLNFVDLKGLTLHIGSQLRDIAPFRAAIEKTYELYKKIIQAGFKLISFDVGGGVGIDYTSADISRDQEFIASYLQVVKDLLGDKVEKIYFEPGRILTARFGVLLTEVQYVKKTPFKNFVIVDAGMHLLMRPSLYQAYHRIEALEASSAPLDVCDVVGPICESADVLGVDRKLPSDLKSGDHLVIYDVGAYGAVMSSRYNLHEEAKEVCVRRGKVL